jgi:hypothetical protein
MRSRRSTTRGRTASAAVTTAAATPEEVQAVAILELEAAGQEGGWDVEEAWAAGEGEDKAIAAEAL